MEDLAGPGQSSSFQIGFAFQSHEQHLSPSSKMGGTERPDLWALLDFTGKFLHLVWATGTIGEEGKEGRKQ